MRTDTTMRVLEDLIETLEDGHKGFTQAAEKLENDDNSGIAAKFRNYANQRSEFSSELRRLAGEAGIDISENGSVAGALHRGWISLADALTGDDPHAVLAAAEAGEDHAVAEYEDAMKSGDLSSGIHDVVVRQYNDIKKAHDEVRNLRDANA